MHLISLLFIALGAFADSLNIGIYSGTFDPPHLGHQEVLERARADYSLDQEIVIVNVSSEHKSGVHPFADRAKMAKMHFNRVPGAIVADDSLEKAFAKDDMPGVFKILRENNPKAKLYLILGDDSFERLAKIPNAAKQLEDLKITLVVAPRDGVPLPRKFGNVEVNKMNFQAKHQSSSTEMRQLLCQGIRPEDKMIPDVIDYALKEKLYMGSCKRAAILPAPAANSAK